MAERHRDDVILQLAHQYEQAYKAHQHWPAYPFGTNKRSAHL